MSDFRVAFDTLSKISKTPSDIASFVTGSGLIKILGEVGTHHEQAAIEVLWDSTASPHPRDRVNSAANSLTEAFTLLSPRYQTSVSRFFNQLMYRVAQEQLYVRSAICAVLVAVCYTYLGESKSSRAKWLKLAEEELTGWKNLFFGRNRLMISPNPHYTVPNPDHVKSAAEILEKFETIKLDLLTTIAVQPTREPAVMSPSVTASAGSSIVMNKRSFSVQDKMSLAEALLACPTMANRQSRDVVVNDLPDPLRGNIRRHDTDRIDVVNMITTALNYDDGLEELITIVRLYEGDSLGMQAVEQVLVTLGLKQHSPRRNPV